MNNRFFASTRPLVALILRRDRLRILIWTLSIGGFLGALIPLLKEYFTSGADNSVSAQMLENPAMVAIVGPVYGASNYNTGAAYGNMMLLFMAITVAIMDIFMVARHTRQDEERGRLEMIRSLPVGRLAGLGATFIATLLTNLLIFLAGTGFMYFFMEDGMTLAGCLLFNAGLLVIGLFFAATTAVLAQVFTNNRSVISWSFALLLFLYCLRGIGDVSNETLSLLSPLGLVLRTKVFVDNDWWPIVILLLITCAVAALAFVLARIRDLGSGLLPERKGHAHASALLSGPGGLAMRLLRTPFIIWTLVMVILAAMYASVFGDLESFMDSNEMLKIVFGQNPDHSPTEQFVGLIIVIMSMIGTIPVLSFVFRPAAEEARGRAENVLSKAISRTKYLTTYLVPALLISLLTQVLMALTFWGVGSIVMDTPPNLKTFIIGFLSFLPAMWVFLGVGTLLVGLLPKRTSLAYLYLGFSFIVVYMGALMNLPDWAKKFTPFGLTPQYPVDDWNLLPLLALTGVAILLTILGYLGYNRRNIGG